jgi:hypothetical protein
MKPLAAIFCPPLYFLIQGRPIAAVIHLVFWLISIVTFFIGIGILIWFVQVSLAGWDLRKQLMEEQATIMASKMAEAMAKPDQSV